MLKYNDPFWWLTVVFKEVGFTEVERNPDDDGVMSIELSYAGRTGLVRWPTSVLGTRPAIPL